MESNGLEFLKLIGVSAAALAMLGGLLLVHFTLKRRDRGFGILSTKIVGIVLFVPTLLILALTNSFPTEVLATLLGTVAGYVLSHGDDSKEGKPAGGGAKPRRTGGSPPPETANLDTP